MPTDEWLLSPGEILVLVVLVVTQLDHLLDALGGIWAWLRGVQRYDRDRARRMVEEERHQANLAALASLRPQLESIALQLLPNGGASLHDIAVQAAAAAKVAGDAAAAASRAAARAEGATEETRQAVAKHIEASDITHRWLAAKLGETEREAAGLPPNRRLPEEEERER